MADIPSVEEIAEQLSQEGTNFGAKNRKIDSLTLWTNFMLVRLWEQGEDTNRLLRQIRNELRD